MMAASSDETGPGAFRSIKFRKQRPKALKETPAPAAPATLDMPTKQLQGDPRSGRLLNESSMFHFTRSFLWGAVQDMLALSHGSGCGYFTEGYREPCFERSQGIDSFQSLHATTSLQNEDLGPASDQKLARALDEAHALFPLARGMVVLAEDPAELIHADFHAVAKAKPTDIGKPVIPLSAQGYRAGPGSLYRDTDLGLRALAQNSTRAESTPYDIVLMCNRPGSFLLWEVRKLLTQIGLNVIAQWSIGSSVNELQNIEGAKLAICFQRAPVAEQHPHPHAFANALHKRAGVPWLWTCFLTPQSTDDSLRAIAARFDKTIQDRAEDIIAANKPFVESVITRYRPRLEGKLIMDFANLPRIELEPFECLGIRIGNANGWPAKSGIWRIPRKNCDFPLPNEDALASLLREAKPDALIGTGWAETEAKKRGHLVLEAPFVFDQERPGYWGYAGFARFVAHLDHELSHPWRQLIDPPWKSSG